MVKRLGEKTELSTIERGSIAETRGGVNALLLWEAPLLLPTGSSKGAWSRLVQP
jgi:hypothetical protein